jgi:pimeloyl-ACP methyl ester carboxylesterase
VVSVAVVAASVSLLGACTPTANRGGESGGTTTRPTTTGPTTTGGVHVASDGVAGAATDPPVTPVAWTPCANGLQCGSVVVPLDYARPQGPSITVALARHPAGDPAARIGSLVINPGGPGASGIDDLPNELAALDPEVVARFDVVSFDPRGVDRSNPVTCGEGPGGAPTQLPDPAPTDAATQKALLDNDLAYAAGCKRASGAVLDYVGTVDAAMDLERIRVALGDPELTYVGHSYGTLLGETYADLYPTHIRAMVLDSVIDPSLSMVDMVSDQAVGFETVLDDFLAWCQASSSCGWRPTGAPKAALLALIAASRAQRLPGYGGRGAGPGEFYDALLNTLGARSFWPSLGRALGQAEAGNGASILALSDSYTTHGSTNLSDANAAVNCLDHPSPSDPAQYPALAALAASRAPVFGPLLTWGILGCGVWEEPATRLQHDISAPGSPPILVVGTTKDPATPYGWAVHVAAMLQHGVLVTRDGEDHVAEFYSPCVRALVASYVVAGTVPATGTTCTS